MRISDWSSDVCSSDLTSTPPSRAISKACRQRKARDCSRISTPRPPSPKSSADSVGARARSSFRSEEHTSELQSLMRNSYAVLCLKKTKTINQNNNTHKQNRKKYKT